MYLILGSRVQYIYIVNKCYSSFRQTDVITGLLFLEQNTNIQNIPSQNVKKRFKRQSLKAGKALEIAGEWSEQTTPAHNS